MTGDVDAAYFQALKDHRSDSILADGGQSDDVDSMPSSKDNGTPKMVRKVQELTIDEVDESTLDNRLVIPSFDAHSLSSALPPTSACFFRINVHFTVLTQ